MAAEPARGEPKLAERIDQGGSAALPEVFAGSIDPLLIQSCRSGAEIGPPAPLFCELSSKRMLPGRGSATAGVMVIAIAQKTHLLSSKCFALKIFGLFGQGVENAFRRFEDAVTSTVLARSARNS